MIFEELSILLGGPQGSGLETAMHILSRVIVYSGYGVIADREYFSNITGRHSYIHMRISSETLPRSLTYPVSLLAAMDAETIFTHFSEVDSNGVVVYDKSIEGRKLQDVPSIEDKLRLRIENQIKKLGISDEISSILKFLEENKNIKLVKIDFPYCLKTLASKFRIDPRILSRYVSGIIVSAVSFLLNFSEEILRYGFETQFSSRRELVEQNMFLAKIVEEQVNKYKGFLQLKPSKIDLDKAMVVTGNDVVAMAKIVAGLKYQSYYPITPAADESFLLEKYEYIEVDGERIGSLIVMQTEDEIAAIASAIGAALVGARAATATSGPGFDLMVESISWAGANEVPVVITYYQRGGPSTGQPTRGSQSDLFNAIFAAHGEFARVVISSGDHVEAFYDTIEVFNIAEKYQLPVIHLLDKFLANTTTTIPIPRLENVEINRGYVVDGGREYRRFDISKTISPRAFIGSLNTIIWYSGDEHDEYGHIVEDSENRMVMYSKRIEKLKIIDLEIPSEFKLKTYGDKNPDYVLIGWGSVKGVALDAIDVLERKKLKGMYINIRMLWPFPCRELVEILSSVSMDRIIAVEHSYGVNIASLISMTTGITIKKKIAKYSGRPIVLNELVEALNKIFETNENRMVLTLGA